MSDLALFSQGGNTLPAHLRNLELDATTKALMGGGGTGKRISIRGGVFRMIVGGKEVYLVELTSKDPSELGFRNFTKLIQNTIPLTYYGLMEKKLTL